MTIIIVKQIFGILAKSVCILFDRFCSPYSLPFSDKNVTFTIQYEYSIVIGVALNNRQILESNKTDYYKQAQRLAVLRNDYD